MNLSPVARRKKRRAPQSQKLLLQQQSMMKYGSVGCLAPPSLTKVSIGYSEVKVDKIAPVNSEISSKASLDCCEDGDCLLCLIRQSVSGRDAVFKGPFGKKKVIYCDYTASGKSLDFVEQFIQEFVQPFYANTHTSANITGKQTSDFRRDARDIIKKCVNANEDDVVIFTGSGTTAAVNKLVHVLQLDGARAKHTVVMTGPFEHHSNILPWKEKRVRFERIPQSRDGLLDLKDLETKLRKYKARGYNIIVSLSAASNVTGIKTDTVTITKLIHKYGGLSFWDYAAGGPYMTIDMNPSHLGAKDAVYLSPHKFVGGPGTPGLLIAKKKLFHNAVPDSVGGGTVVYVTRETRLFHDNIEDREEGGTPAIVESVRAGLVFKIKRAIGEDVIEEREEMHCRKVFSQLGKHPGIRILGSQTLSRLPIISMLLYNPQSGRYLHHNFVSVILNDLYGIQVRSGCACAGPYAMDLLNMNELTATRFARLLADGWCDKGKSKCSRSTHHALGIMKPGFSRFNMPYFVDDETADYVLHGISMVATHGWKLLPMYCCDTRTGDWFNRSQHNIQVNSLHNLHISGTGVSMDQANNMFGSGNVSLATMKMDAIKTFQSAETLCKDIDCSRDPEVALGKEYEELRWFMLPREAKQLLDTPPEMRPFILYPDCKLPFKTNNNGDKHTTLDTYSSSGDSAYDSEPSTGSFFELDADDTETGPEMCYGRMCMPHETEDKSRQLSGLGFHHFGHSPTSKTPPSDGGSQLSSYNNSPGGFRSNRLGLSSYSMSTPNLSVSGKKHNRKDGCVIC